MGKLSRLAAGALVRLGEVSLLGLRAFRAAPKRPLEIRSFLREAYDQGYRALGLMVLMSGFAGLVLSFQFGESLVRFGARQYIGQLTSLALLREMMPVLTALVLGGRIVAGIAAEVGSMAATEQVDAVRALGADPVKKLVMPRVLAATVTLPVLTVLGDLIGTFAGMVVARFEFGLPMRFYLTGVREFLLVSDFTSGLAKSAVFGLTGSVIACDAGLRSQGGTYGVGRATTSAVVASSLVVIVADYLMTRMFFPTEDIVR
ncbi:MAG: ABC transporter permease [Deltaproteobacteria bacterium]|nr:ABC transporter permease [Deltaproteobacteria bacterium]